MPIFAEGYENYESDYGSFVEHPVYGMCYAKEHYQGEDLYLRLYRMSDVLEEINRSLPHTINGIARN